MSSWSRNIQNNPYWVKQSVQLIYNHLRKWMVVRLCEAQRRRARNSCRRENNNCMTRQIFQSILDKRRPIARRNQYSRMNQKCRYMELWHKSLQLSFPCQSIARIQRDNIRNAYFIAYKDAYHNIRWNRSSNAEWCTNNYVSYKKISAHGCWQK